MYKQTLSALLVALATTGLVACSSTGDRGPVEQTAANAGRVVDDSVLTAKVKSALIADETTKAYQISVTTFEGTVQLSGFVDDAEARRKASQVASNVEGVRDVKNELEVRSGG